jgi:tetratricopeptide (TPR) repeat protein
MRNFITGIIITFIPLLCIGNDERAVPAFGTGHKVVQNFSELQEPSDTIKVDTLLKYLTRNHLLIEPGELITVSRKAIRISDSLINVYPAKYKRAAKNRKASALMHLSILSARVGEREQAHAAIEQAIGYYKDTGHERGLAKAYSNLSTLYAMYSDFVPGLKYQLMSLKILEELKDSTALAACYYNLAITYLETRDFVSAKKYVLESMKIKESLNQKNSVIDCLSLLGGIYYQNKETELALKTHKKALAESKKEKYEYVQGEILANIANIFSDRDNFDSAIFYYEAARKIHRKFSDGLSLTRTSASLGFVYTETGNFRKAKEFLLVAADSLTKYPDHSLLETVYDKLVTCDSALGNKDDAIRYSRLAKAVAVKNSAGETKAELSDLQHQFEVDKKMRENQRLRDRNKIQELEIYRSKLFALILAIIFVFTLLTFLLLYRQQRLKTVNTTIELEQRLLRSQMNPHFIFNALQAIQNFARRNNTEKLLKYLDSFASLTRDVLESSRVELIPLSREIVLLQNYLTVQKLRFGNRFEYTIHVAEDIRTNSVFLPPMLSQPFIENAIEHGLAEMEEGGRLDIYFKVEHDYLLMEIVDNGVGMQKDETHQEKHASLAIAITRERIALLNKKDRRKSEFTITDATSNTAAGKGVRVLFKIPIS